MKKVGLFWYPTERLPYLEVAERFRQVEQNTGNLLYIEALKNVLSTTPVAYNPKEDTEADPSECDSFVTTGLSWICENTEYPMIQSMLKRIGQKKLVPISIGIQGYAGQKTVRLHPNTVRLLMEISERCEMGIRGEYTAGILESYGIRNMRVIGCPSLYFSLGREHRIVRQEIQTLDHVAANFRTFYDLLPDGERRFLRYAAQREWGFVEQTALPLKPEHLNDPPLFEMLDGWLQRQSRVFFSVAEWREWMAGYQFAIGSRFHGNVIAMLNRTPVLFIVRDERMAEMCRFFHLPTLLPQEFDDTKDPMFYYEKADFTEFNKTFPSLEKNYRSFLVKNGLLERKPVWLFGRHKTMPDKVEQV